MRIQKSAPGAFSPFSFSEESALSTKSKNDRSLLLEIFSSTKGGLIKSIDDVKSSAKTTVTVPQDFHSFHYQLKAFAIALGFVFGEDSILATRLRDFVEKVDKNSMIYRNRITIGDTFAAKVLWSVDCFTQLFLNDCLKCLDREDIDQRVIDFDNPPSPLHKLNDKLEENNEGLQWKRRRAKKQPDEIVQNHQHQSGRRVQDGRRRDLGGDFPRKMPR